MKLTLIEKMKFENFFENFDLTDENKALYAVCREAAETPEQFRLLFVHAAADERFCLKWSMLNKLKENQREFKSISIQDFCDDAVTKIKTRKNKAENYSEYTEPAILCCDDFQFIAGKEATQEQFYRCVLKPRLEQKRLTVVFSEVSLEQLLRTRNCRVELLNFLRLGCVETET